MLLIRLFQSFRTAKQNDLPPSAASILLLGTSSKNFLARSECISFLMTCQACFLINRKHGQATVLWISARPLVLLLLGWFVFHPCLTASVKRGSVASSIECHVCPHSFYKSESYRINISTIKVLNLFFVWWIFNHLFVFKIKSQLFIFLNILFCVIAAQSCA